MANKPKYDELLDMVDVDEDEDMEVEEDYVGDSAEVDGLLGDVLNTKLSPARRKQALYDVIHLCAGKVDDDGAEDESF